MDKLAMSEDTVQRILKAGTYRECLEILKESFPGTWPEVHPNQLPDAVNRHILAVMKWGAGELYDPPPDPNGISRFSYKE